MQPDGTVGREEVGEITPPQFSRESQMPVLAELLCSESPIQDMDDDSPSSVQSYFDPALLHHPEVLTKLKNLETQTRQPRNYFQAPLKDEILPYMRKVVSMWMLEVLSPLSPFPHFSQNAPFLILRLN